MLLERFLFIYNRDSGSDKINELLAELLPIYQEHGILLTPFCLNIGSKSDFLPLLKEGDFKGILISGGDGSINSIIGFLLDSDIHLPIGILPAGTCNDLANSLGLPKNIREAAMIPLMRKTILADIGRVDDKHFFFSSCAGGYFMPATYNTPTHAKKNIKQFAYYFKAATKFTSFKPFDLAVSIDGNLHKFRALMFAFATGKQIAGFSNILNEASLKDGVLDLIIIEECSYLELPTILFNILKGQFVSQKYVHYFQGKEFHIDGPMELPIVFDGEEGNHLPFRIDIYEKSIELFV